MAAGIEPFPGIARPMTSEHAGAGTASAARFFGDFFEFFGGDFAGGMFADAFEDGDEVGLVLAGEHRAAADIERWHIEANHGVEHRGNDFVAVADADPSVARVCANDRFDLVGD